MVDVRRCPPFDVESGWGVSLSHPRLDSAPTVTASPMSWDLLKRFLESDVFNSDPFLSVSYLS